MAEVNQSKRRKITAFSAPFPALPARLPGTGLRAQWPRVEMSHAGGSASAAPAAKRAALSSLFAHPWGGMCIYEKQKATGAQTAP